MFNQLITKGIIPKKLIQIAGPPNSGKTTILYNLCAHLSSEKKALIFDCEMKFSPERLIDVISNKQRKVNLHNIVIIRLYNIKEQFRNIMSIHNYIQEGVFSFIAINGITDHFRSLNKSKRTFSLKRIFTMQLAYLKHLSSQMRIPVVFTNQIVETKTLENKLIPVLNNTVSLYSDHKIIISRSSNKLLKATEDGESYFYKITEAGIKIME
ncbi:MAG: DnaB-like helicase C-terminal domain-containing protein [Candidatus Heimdallarchaeaceae archaeon]